MNIYEVFGKSVDISKPYELGLDISNELLETLDCAEDKILLDLVRNVYSMHMDVKMDGVEFRPMCIFEDKRTFSVEDLGDEDYDLLASLEYEKLPVNIKARIADVLWTEKKKYQYALIAIDSYYELFNILFKDDDWLVALRMMKRACCISAQIKKTESLNRCCQLAYDHVIRLDGNDTKFLSIFLVEILLNYSFGSLEKIEAILDKILDLSKSNPRKMEEAFDLKYKCVNKLHGFEKAKLINIDKARYFVEYGEQLYNETPDKALRAEIYLQKAIILFRNNGEPHIAECTHRRLIDIQKHLISTLSGYKETIDISKSVKFVSDIMADCTFEESVTRLSQLTHFYTKQEGQEYVINDLHEFPLLNLAKKIIVNQEGQTVFALEPLSLTNPYENEDLLEAHIHHKLFEMEEYDGNIVLRVALAYIRENFDISKQEYHFLFDNNGIIPESRKGIIEKGIRLAFEGEYYAALHILATQAENIFRYIAKLSGALTVTFESKGDSDAVSKQKTLSSIFDLPELLDCYDNDILFLFKGLLNEHTGANIRNNIAHGILEEASGSSGVSIYFICAMIKLIVFSSPGCLTILKKKTEISVQKIDYDLQENAGAYRLA